MNKRTALKCQASGCDGCIVCKTDEFGGQKALAEYRVLEERVNRLLDDMVKQSK